MTTETSPKNTETSPKNNELIRELDPETAKAVETLAKFGIRVLDTADKAGSYTAGIFGRLPHNLVGMLDDLVAHKRIRRCAALFEETKRILDSRNVKEPYIEVSLVH